MNTNTRPLHLFIILALFLGACNLPRKTVEDIAATAAAQTVEALLSATPASTDTPPAPLETVTPISTELPTITPVVSPTPLCNLAQFITDVTIPDGTVMAPGQNFNKKWRVRNIGACAWNGYSLVFDSGDPMGGPASKPIPAVNPGQEVDLDVDLKAPNTSGKHRSYWRIVTNANVLVPIANGYQGKAIFAEINVQAPPTATNTAVSSTTITLTHIPGESGQVRSDGTVLSLPNTGDIESNTAAQAFFSFDISSIPAGKTITKVVVDFGGGHDSLGNPWALGDGCVRAYVQNYGTLDAADFFVGDPTGAVLRWCGSAQLNSVFEDNDVKAALQAALGNSRFQLRVQFRQPTVSNNGIADMIRFGTVKLIVTYQ